MKLWAIIGLAALLSGSAIAAKAADIVMDGGETYAQCRLAAESTLAATTDKVDLKTEVVNRMDQAISVAKDPDWIASSRPTFLWANETKVACGKAFGYLKRGYQDDEWISKCDCYHARMVSYMN